ncbi:MAG: TonB-dependent receptor [Deltaproteobacteria bacterium]|nr:TonB-dependent receptor [Deltaproteobacteria bacterium]
MFRHGFGCSKWVGLFCFCFLAKALVLSPPWVRADEREPVVMDEIVVSATKTEEMRKDVPNAAIIKDDVDIEESSARGLGEFLANEPGLDWRTQGDYGGAVAEIHIRGMSGNATQVRVNGVTVNSPSVGVADVSRILLNSIERVEVVKGSGSVLYGSGAMGGTVNIITKRPKKEKMDLKVSAGYGSQNTYQISAENGMFPVGDFGYYLTANRRETDGFRDNADMEQNDASLNLVLDKGDALDLSLYGDYFDREYGRPGVRPPEGTESFFVNGTEVYNSDSASLLDSGKDEDYHLVLEAKSKPWKWLGFLVRGDYTELENYNYLRYVDFFGSLVGSETWTTNKVLGAEGNIDIRPFEGLNFLLGAEYNNFDWNNQSVSLDPNGAKLPATQATAKADRNTTGVFAEGQYRPFKYFKALLGVRHQDDSEFGTVDLPRFGAIVNPWDDAALKLTHGKHFLAPTLNDLFWPADPFAKGNPDLEPEEGWHSDVTWEQSFVDNRFFYALSYFHWDVDNKIQWGPDSNGVFTPQNLRTYEADGLEVGTTIGPFYNTTLGFYYTYVSAEEEAKDYTKQQYYDPGGWLAPGVPPPTPADFEYTWVKRRAAYTPEHLFRTDLTYWSDYGLTAKVTLRYVSDRLWYRTETDVVYPATKTVRYSLDPYWTMDAKVEQRVHDHWFVSLQINNFFGEEYDTYFGTFQDTPPFGPTTVEGFPGAGRSVFFNVRYEY